MPFRDVFGMVDGIPNPYQLYEISIRIRLRGDGITRGVQKGHLKKTDAVKQLINRAITNIKNKYYNHSDDSSSSTTCPPSLTSSVQPIPENLERVKEQVRRDEGVILPSVHGLKDEQLERLTEVFDTRSSTEEKLNSAVNIFLEKDIEKIQSSIDYLEFLKFEMMQCFVASFGHLVVVSFKRTSPTLFRTAGASEDMYRFLMSQQILTLTTRQTVVP